jgi:hypothetical protein
MPAVIPTRREFFGTVIASAAAGAATRQFSSELEIDTGQDSHVGANEVGPRCVLTAFRGRRYPEPPKDVANGLIGYGVTEVSCRSLAAFSQAAVTVFVCRLTCTWKSKSLP